MIGGDILPGGTKGNDRKIRVIFFVSGARDESNDLAAHANPSHTAMAISPTSASDIRYVVMEFSS